MSFPRARIHRFIGNTPTATYLGTGTISSGLVTGLGIFAAFDAAAPPPAHDRVIAGFLAVNDNVTPREVVIGDQALPIYSPIARLGFFMGCVPSLELPGTISSTAPRLPIPIRFSAAFFNSARIFLWSVTGLASYAPIDVKSSTTAVAADRSVDLNTNPGGIVLAAAINDVATSCTWTGDQTPNERHDSNNSAITATVADISSANDDPANTLTATFALPSLSFIALVGASLR